MLPDDPLSSSPELLPVPDEDPSDGVAVEPGSLVSLVAVAAVPGAPVAPAAAPAVESVEPPDTVTSPFCGFTARSEPIPLQDAQVESADAVLIS